MLAHELRQGPAGDSRSAFLHRVQVAVRKGLYQNSSRRVDSTVRIEQGLAAHHRRHLVGLPEEVLYIAVHFAADEFDGTLGVFTRIAFSNDRELPRKNGGGDDPAAFGIFAFGEWKGEVGVFDESPHSAVVGGIGEDLTDTTFRKDLEPGDPGLVSG